MPSQGLFGALVFSTRCAVKLTGFDFTAAYSSGAVSVLTAEDIPAGGNNSIASDYPLFVAIGNTGEEYFI
jgi:xanthine dehydrogenase molybdopterin-binding subunit B